ncbi:MAG TPA: MBL fold metallo-hydrolase [Solirubrobacteraceae bacterium]|nr:MBL fold metallo-hydrolase [Solirubrobacteraceae bacterium]
MAEVSDQTSEAPPASAPSRPARSAARRELGRGERVLPGIYRLRLPLPWPGVPHCNAWAVACRGGYVLFDTGMNQPDSLANLQRALAMCGIEIADIRLIVCTHAHSDHCGQAPVIAELAGCEIWMHPSHELLNSMVEDPDAVFARRVEVARQSGVPAEPLERYAAERKTGQTGFAGVIEPARDLVNGVVVHSDLGDWTTYETPGHSPSHVCLFQPERRLLISGDHLLGRISLYFEYGNSPDPVGEFLNSLEVVERLGARLCLPGHGRTFADVHAHIQGNRRLVRERLENVAEAIGGQERTAFEVVPLLYGDALSAGNAHWLISKTLAYLTHLERIGQARRIAGEPERWTA